MNKKREKKLSLRIFASFVFLGMLIFIFIISVWPLVNGKIFGEGTKKLPFPLHVKFPEYWYEASNWINNKKLDMKIITTPNNQFYAIPFKWRMYGTDSFVRTLIVKDILNIEYGYKTNKFYNKIMNTLYDNIKNNNKKIVFFLSQNMNVRYFLQRDEIISRPETLSIDALKRFFDSSLKTRKVSSFTNLDFYQISNEYFLPHFYTPQDIIISDQTVNGLPQIISQPDYKIRSAIYFDEKLKVLEQYNSKKVIVFEVKQDKIEKLDEEIKKINETITNLEAKDFKKLSKKDKLLLKESNEQKQGLEQEKARLQIDPAQYFAEVTEADNYNFSFQLAFCQQEESLLLDNIPLITINGVDYDIPYEIVKAEESDRDRKVGKYKIKTDNDCFISIKDIELNEGELKIATNYILSLDNLVFSKDYPKEIETPVLEFKKINPTKYVTRIHQAKDSFPLVFSESFHQGWKAYIVESSKVRKVENSGVESEKLSEYKILDGNEEDQASREEIEGFIKDGLIFALGNGKEKQIKHKKYENGQEKLDYIEKYSIDFVSKNFQDTIQNDNLLKGHIWDTWFKKPLAKENHLIANGYANSWWIDIEKVCKVESGKVKSFCQKNSDGSYDFELVVEFWPQRLFYLGLLISGITLLGCIGYIGYSFTQKKRKLRG